MIQNSNVLVTGGYGFIGAHLADTLAHPELGNAITILDINTGETTTGHDLGLSENEGITTVRGSVTDPEGFSELPQEFDHIIHAAGFLGINNVAQKQALTLDVNVAGTRNCLEFAAQHEVKPRVLYFSTSEIYGKDCAGHAENEPAVIPSSGSRWCYAASKLTGEYYLRAYNQQHGIGGGIVRPFNVFGPHRYGSNAMTALTTRAVNDEDLTISGDGRQVRAWCYIEDFCDGVLSILEHPGEEIEAFNIGDDRNVFTMLGLAQKIIEAANSKSQIVTLGDSIEDVFYRIPDIDKARNLLGYNPTTDFDVALENVVKWARAAFGQNDGK